MIPYSKQKIFISWSSYLKHIFPHIGNNSTLLTSYRMNKYDDSRYQKLNYFENPLAMVLSIHPLPSRMINIYNKKSFNNRRY